MPTRWSPNPVGQQLLFSPGGPVGREATKIGSEMVEVARAIGPKRTGRLVGSIGNNGIMAHLGYTVTMYTRVDYALYVLAGTPAEIFPTNGEFMRVPAFKGATWRVNRRQVSGQDANNFFVRAGNIVLSSRGYGPIMRVTALGYVL